MTGAEVFSNPTQSLHRVVDPSIYLACLDNTRNNPNQQQGHVHTTYPAW
jgi:hypothetical protein